MTAMRRVTDEQIARAKEWDLLSYLQTFEPRELKRSGPHEYRTVTHGSLVISNGKWHWFREGIGGKTALDYLIKVRGMDFVEAVKALSGAGPLPAFPQSVPTPPKPFRLPEADRCAVSVISYLRKRGIDPEILSRCIQNGSLYESRNYHNCVFVGRDMAGKARFACLRGTFGDFRMDVEGSDKRFGFVLPSADPQSRTLFVAESPIDALSRATLRKLEAHDWDRASYLSLSGTSPLALLQYLADHPAVGRVSLGLDNDAAGRKGMAKIQKMAEKDELLRRCVLTSDPPPRECGKDYNLMLQQKLAGIRPRRERSFSR